jgi:hypothetical protein
MQEAVAALDIATEQTERAAQVSVVLAVLMQVDLLQLQLQTLVQGVEVVVVVAGALAQVELEQLVLLFYVTLQQLQLV